MEGNELNSVSGSHPLFCTIVALWSLTLLYLPHLFLTIVFSPVLVITGSLLLTLLRVGAAQRGQVESNYIISGKEECDSGDEDRESITNEADSDSEPELGFDPGPCFEDSFVGWNVRAPLEVIYEEFEGEDNEGRPVAVYYRDSDLDSSSDGGWDSPENISFRWDEEDREGLIEIALDKSMMDFQGEEENLIEIDISPSRMDQLPVMD